MIFWQAGGGDWLLRVTGASQNVAIQRGALLVAQLSGVLRLLSVLCRRVRAVLVCLLPAPLAVPGRFSAPRSSSSSPGFWWKSGWRSTPWYAPFYDLIQSALATPHKVSINQFYQEIGVFSRHRDHRGDYWRDEQPSSSATTSSGWRTAMNEHYMAHWQHLRHIEGAAQRVQEDTMRFASTLEDMGVSFMQRGDDPDRLPAGAGDALRTCSRPAYRRPSAVWPR
ncbi:hypothetical protein LNQ03_10590 [Klebsiella pneumoniae subsp. pneumoniae]|nr:hypothetical protein [Klebsiella pneumoniae subsp. pneumoniae]